jgi:hypothetical protein
MQTPSGGITNSRLNASVALVSALDSSACVRVPACEGSAAAQASFKCISDGFGLGLGVTNSDSDFHLRCVSDGVLGDAEPLEAVTAAAEKPVPEPPVSKCGEDNGVNGEPCSEIVNGATRGEDACDGVMEPVWAGSIRLLNMFKCCAESKTRSNGVETNKLGVAIRERHGADESSK